MEAQLLALTDESKTLKLDLQTTKSAVAIAVAAEKETRATLDALQQDYQSFTNSKLC